MLEYLPRDGQRGVVSLPVTSEVSDFVGRHVKRAIHVPPQAVEPDEVQGRNGVGRSMADAPEIDGIVKVKGLKNVKVGELVRVRITAAGDHDLAAVTA